MRRTRETDRGASLVEFALVIPILTLFLFGIVQFGIAYDKQQSINSAAREGARTAAIPTNSYSDVDTATRNAFQGLADDDDITVTVSNEATGYLKVASTTPVVAADGPCAPIVGVVVEGTTVVVEAKVQHTLTIPFYGSPDLTITGRGEFRCERAP